MTVTLILEGKVLGSKKPLFSDWRMELPPLYEKGGDRVKLRDLIEAVVIEEVQGYLKRQEERRFAHFCSRQEIEQGVEKGMVDMGGREPGARIDPQEAIATALQAFEDGLYYVFIDDKQQTNLDGEIYLKLESKVVFLRLVALAGG